MKKYIISLFALVTLFASCSKDAFELDPIAPAQETKAAATRSSVDYVIPSNLIGRQYGCNIFAINENAPKARLLMECTLPCANNEFHAKSTAPAYVAFKNSEYHDEYQWFCSSFYQSEGLPLCNVTTTSEGYSCLNDEYSPYLKSFSWYVDALASGYFQSQDMNKGKCNWIHLYFGTSKEYAQQYYPESLKSSDGRTYFNYTFKDLKSSTTITGLRLVIDPTGKHPNIIDENGVEWKSVIGYDGKSHNFNAPSGGSKMYLYYTTDARTGRKLMLTLPESKNTINLTDWSDGVGGDCHYANALLTFPFSWTEETKTIDKANTVDEIKDIICNDIIDWCNYKQDEKTAEISTNLVNNNFDFIRLYELKDGHMVSVDEGYPANFQHGKSTNRILQSYLYITPASPYWNMF